jgi:hypothetical protein
MKGTPGDGSLEQEEKDAKLKSAVKEYAQESTVRAEKSAARTPGVSLNWAVAKLVPWSNEEKSVLEQWKEALDLIDRESAG